MAGKSQQELEADFVGRGFASLLQPIAELAMHLGLSPREMRDVVDQAAVAAVCQQIRREEKREPTAARLSIQLGLTKAQAQIFLEEENRALRTEKLAADVMTVITRWYTDSRFSSLYGVPYELPIGPDAKSGFRDLVSSCEVAATSDTILEEMIVSGTAELVGEARLRITNRTYKLPSNTNTQLARFFQIVRHFNDTCVQNIVRVKHGEPSFLEIDVHTDTPISPSSFAAISKTAGEKLVSIIHETDTLLNQTTGVPDPNGIVGGIGVYFYTDRSSMSPKNVAALTEATDRLGF